MEDKSIIQQIIGGLGILFQQQNQTLSALINNSETQSQKVDVVVSGNSLSLLDMVCKDNEAAKKLEGVASSFAVLNQQLETYEKIFKGIQDIQLSENTSHVNHIMKLFSFLTDGEYIRKISEVNTTLDSEKQVLLDFVAALSSTDFKSSINGIVANIGQSSDVINTFLDNAEKFNGMSFDSLTSENVEKLCSLYFSVSEKLGEIKTISEEKKTEIEYIKNFFNSMNDFDDVVVGKYTLEGAERVGDFFVSLNDRLISLSEINQISKESIAFISDFVKSLDKFDTETVGRYDTQAAAAFGEFFVEMVNQLSGLREIPAHSKQSIDYIRSLVELTKGGNISFNISNFLQNANKEMARDFAQFFVAMTEELNNIPQITREQNNSIQYLTQLLKFMSEDGIINALNRNAVNLNTRSARVIGEFFSSFMAALNEIPSVEKNQERGLKYALDVLNGMSQEGMGKRIAMASFWYSARIGRRLAQFYSTFANELATIQSMDAQTIRTVNSLMNIIQMMGDDGFARRMWVAQMLIGKGTGRRIGEFFSTFAHQLENLDSMDGEKIRSVNTIMKILNEISESRFARFSVLPRFGSMTAKRGKSIGEFFKHFAQEVLTIDASKFNPNLLQNIVDFLNKVSSTAFMAKIMAASLMYKIGSKMHMDTAISDFFREMVNGFMGTDESVKKALPIVEGVVDVVDRVCSPIFVTKIMTASLLYKIGSKMHMDTAISDFFREMVNGFSATDINVKDALTAINGIIDVVDRVCSPIFLGKLMAAALWYKIGLAMGMEKVIPRFFGGMIDALALVLDETKMKEVKKEIGILDEIVSGLVSITGKIILVGLIGFALAAVSGGLLFAYLAVGSTMFIFGLISKIMTAQGDEFKSSLMALSECIIGLSVATLLMGATMLLAKKIGESVNWQPMLAIFGGLLVVTVLVVLLHKFMDATKSTAALIEITASIMMLSVALLAISAAILLANHIESQNVSSLLVVLGVMVILVGILAVIQLTGIGPMALLAGVGLGLVMLVMTGVLVLCLKMLILAEETLKHIPAVKMLISGLIDVLEMIASSVISIAAGMVGVAFFMVAVGALMMATMMAVVVGKIARLFNIKDKIALKNVVNGMLDVFTLIDDYFSGMSPTMNKIPFLGAIQKGMDVLAATGGIIMFALSLSALMMSTILAIMVMKMSRLTSPKDITSMKDLINGFIGTKSGEEGIFTMIENYFGKNGMLSGIPVLGAASEMVNAIGCFASIALFSVAMLALMSVVSLSILVMKEASWVKPKDIKAVKDLTNGMLEVFESIGGSFAFGLLDNISKAASVGLFSAAMLPLLGIMTWYMNLTKKYYDTDVQIGGIGKVSKDMVKSLKDFMTEVNSSFGLMDSIANSVSSAILSSMIPMMNTISKFVDMVGKLATMTFVSGYDRNGKPEYTKVEATVFTAAATAISTSFTSFLTALNKSFKENKNLSTDTIEEMGEALIPMMTAISSYTDSIIRLASSQVIEKYDSNGKPKYMTVTNEMYSNAASVLSTNFTTFIEKLAAESKNIKIGSGSTMKALGEAMMPMMMGISSFADAIVKLGTAQVADGWDKDGKPIHFKRIEEGVYETSAKVVANNFGTFIKVLGDAADDMSGASKDEAKCLADCMSTLMSGIGSFADAIVKLSTMGIPQYDKNGKIVGFTQVDAQAAANTLIGGDGIFTKFMAELGTGFDNLSGKTKEDIKLLSSAMEPLMMAIGSFVDSIVRMATGTYVKGYDKDGKAVTDLIPMDRYSVAAGVVANNFATFVKSLKENLDGMSPQIQSTLEALNKGGVADVMVAVGNFIDALSKYANGKMFIIEGFDKDGKPIYKKNPKTGTFESINLKDVATSIAQGFAAFVSTLTSELNKANIKESVSQSKEVVNLLDEIMSPVKDFVDTVLKLKEKDVSGLATVGKDLSNGLVSILKTMNEGENAKFLETYSTETIVGQIETICGSVDTVIDCVKEIADAFDKDTDIVKIGGNIGEAAITLLQKLNGGEKGNEISKFGSDNMTQEIYKLTLNIKTVLESMKEFDNFKEFDFKSVVSAENDFANAVKNLLSINFSQYEQTFSASVSKTIQTLNNLDKKLSASTAVVSKFEKGVSKAIDTIEAKLATNEKKRNERFNTLVTNLNNVADKLKDVQQGLNKLNQTDMSFIDKINQKIKDLQDAQNNASSLLSNTSFSGASAQQGQKGQQQGGGIPWDGSPLPVYIVNSPVANSEETEFNLFIKLDNGKLKTGTGHIGGERLHT